MTLGKDIRMSFEDHGRKRAFRPRRMIVRLIACVALLVSALVSASPAGAAPIIDRSASVEAIANAGERLRQRLGGAFGGYWLDEATGQLTVGVTDRSQADAARDIGAVPREVSRSAAALDAVQARLDARADTAPASVASWGVDLPTNSLVVQVLEADQAALHFAAAGGDAVRLERVAEAPQPYWNIIGGQAIHGGGSRCSAGFSARRGTERHVITAGHCTNIATTWSGVGGALGTRAGSSFPVDDYGIIRVTSTSAASTAYVDRYWAGSDVVVAGSISAAVGASVCRSGSTTGWRCGTVQATNQTVRYTQGTVYGLTRTTACAEPGDSGGSFVSNPLANTLVQAQGLTSGGSGNCASGGTTYFQPVNEVLSRYGLILTVA